MGSRGDCAAPKRTPCLDLEEDLEGEESVAERLWGLAEMFPEKWRAKGNTAWYCAKGALSKFFTTSKTTLWIFFSSSAILFVPVLVEVERCQVVEAAKCHAKQALLGQNRGTSWNTPLPSSSFL